MNAMRHGSGGLALVAAAGLLTMVAPWLAAPASADASLRVDPLTVTGKVNPHVYGHFLEHIYHSVSDGLCGELVRDRSFVVPEGGFEERDGVLCQTSLATDVTLLAGDPGAADYEFSVRARKTGGAEGFLIIVRATSADELYWWNLGGWGNVRHALEVEVGGGRTPQAGTEGRIETGRWYDIRVRVESDHIEGWLDGEKLLDAHDSTHLRGMVGLGTWATTAEFRDMALRDLDGNDLPLEFAPEALAPVTDSWETLPGGEPVPLVRTDSPNTGWSAALDPPAVTGMAQDRFNAVNGRTYYGRAWLRSEGAVRGITVSLATSDGAVMDSGALEAGPDGWTECPFTLTATSDDPDASLLLTAHGDGRLLVDMVSLMRDDSLDTGCRADLLEAVRALRPPIIRWPGGCFASIYHWKSSVGPQQERKPFYNRPWDEWDPGSFGTDEFIRLCREVGAEPLIVLNLGSWDAPEKWEEYLQEAIDWVEYCNGDASTPMGALRARNGHPEPYHVTHWELDNETWGMRVEPYAERLIPFAKAVRERVPDARLYACTFWREGDPKLLELAGEYFDVISYHLYDDPANFAQGPEQYRRIWEGYPEIVAASQNDDVTLAITEWNAQSTDFRTGLFAAGLLNVMERLDVVEMASPALFLRRTDASAWDNAFINHDHTGWFPAPNYVVMKLYREHYQPLRVQLDAEGPLNAVATRSEDGRTLVLKVVNPTAEAVPTSLAVADAFPVVEAVTWTVSAEPLDRNTLEEPNRIAPVERVLAGASNAFETEFPAYSVTVVELRGSE